MTPKAKAEQLIKRYTIILEYDVVADLQWHPPNDIYRNARIKKDAKKCALAAVEFIVEQNNVWINNTRSGANNYWNEVKKHIKNL